MLNHTFTFNGHSSDEFGIKIERFRALNRPARKFDAASVPGRNGNIYKLQDAYEETLVSYQIWSQGRPDTNLLDMTIEQAPFTGTDYGYIISGTISSLNTVVLYNETQGGTYGNYHIDGISGISGVDLYYRIDRAHNVPYVSGPVPADGIDLSVPPSYILTVSLRAQAGTYNNVLVPVNMLDRSEVNLEARWTDIMEWLNSADGYAELTDTYDTEHYREAVFVDATDIENSWNRIGRALISFRCRPERFLSSGQIVPIDFTNTSMMGYILADSLNIRESAPSGNIIKIAHEGDRFDVLDSTSVSGITWYKVRLEDRTVGWCQSQYNQTQYVAVFNAIVVNNPTKREAKPNIEMTVGGTLKLMINGKILTVSHSAHPLYIDCENENITGVITNGSNMDELVSFNKWSSVEDLSGNVSADFLTLQSGNNYISVDGSTNVSDCTFEMRFWEL